MRDRRVAGSRLFYHRIAGASVLFAMLALAVARTFASATATRATATVSARTNAVGALFTLNSRGGLGSHFCTATVVDSPKRDMVVTAAHCLAGAKVGSLAFVPAYHKGIAPMGIWVATKIVVDSAWTNAADPDHDFAFVVVHRPGSPSRIESLTGGEQLRVLESEGKQATVIGYPASASAAITCTNSLLAFTATQLEFDCDGYTNGTSGSALVIDPDPTTGLGTVVGVIGGYQQGGNTASISYAAAFSTETLSLYQQAIKSS
jgi:V8-like Glu-specific endopeptidase